MFKIAEFWTKEQTLLLISEYKKKELLYKKTHPDYLTVSKRNEALEDIVLSLKEIKPNVTTSEIKKKIRALHKNMSEELEKISAYVRNGMAAGSVYTSTLWCFNDLRFLLNTNHEDREHSNIESDNKVEPPACVSGVYDTGSSQKDKCSENEEVSDLQQSSNESIEPVSTPYKTNNEKDKEEILCKMLCSELKQLKLEETYDNVTSEFFSIVRKTKQEEREKLAMQSLKSIPAAPSY